MKIQFCAVILGALALLGCSNKDKEMASRTSDGSETFKFKPPADRSPGSASAGEASVPPPPLKPARVDPKDSDGSDTFVYKPSPELLKQLNKNKVK